MTEIVELIILGEPASKSNSRRLLYSKGRPRIIKSAKALHYLSNIKRQLKPRDPLLTGDIVVYMKIWYASRRPDLDPSLIFDALQGLLYANDRQIKRFTCEWGLDKRKPRTYVRIEQLPAGWDTRTWAPPENLAF